MRIKRNLLVTAFLTMICFAINAQKHEIGFGVGGMNYRGEVATDIHIRNTRPSLYAFYKHNFSPAFAIRPQIKYGEFSAKDEHVADPLPQARRHQIVTTIVEFAAIGEYNFLDFRKYNDRRRFSPYLAFGVGYFLFLNEGVDRRRTSDGTGICIPLGAGLKYKMTRTTNIGFELVARKTFTDQLDGIGNYRLANGLQAGDPHSRDWYYFAGITLSYVFYGIECPKHFR